MKDFEIAYNTIILKNQELFELKSILEIKFGTAIFESLVFKNVLLTLLVLYLETFNNIFIPLFIF